MARGHLFVIVILLAAAAVAGLLAVSRTAAQATTPAAGADPAIAFRMKKLDRLEASLEQQIARRRATTQRAPVVVYKRATAPVATVYQDDEGATESEDEGERDD